VAKPTSSCIDNPDAHKTGGGVFGAASSHRHCASGALQKPRLALRHLLYNGGIA